MTSLLSALIWAIVVVASMEDRREETSLGVNALERIKRGSEAVATKLGPSFHTEPPMSFTISNDTGGVIDCTAYGVPPPKITWLRYDPEIKSPQVTPMQELAPTSNDKSALWEILTHNNSLKLRPFSPLEYNPQVHKAAYVCRASSESGTILSRTINVKSVLREDFAVRVKAPVAATSALSLSSSETVEVTSGNSLVLRCEVSRSALLSHLVVESWMKIENGRHISIAFAKTSHGYTVRDSGHLVLHNGDLVIVNAKEAGEYSCKVKNLLTNQVTKGDSLKVLPRESDFDRRRLERPVMQDPSATYIEANFASTAILPCFSLGSPPPITSWFKESHHHLLDPLPNDARFKHVGGAIVIDKVTLQDAGSYRCVSRNSIGESSTTLHLVVRQEWVVVVEPDLQVADYGSNAEFYCKIFPKDQGASPSSTAAESEMEKLAKSVKWLKDGKVVTEKDLSKIQKFGPKLRVNNAQTEDNGVYQCFVTLASGLEIQSAGELRLGDTLPSLSYAFIEQTLQPGPLVSLKCSASGNPTPRITWTLDGYSLPENDRFMIGQYVTVHGDVISHLNISETFVEDGGIYGCEAKNRAGSKKHFGRLNIYGPPKARSFPKDLKAIEGQKFILHCPMGGYPLDSVRWDKDGGRMSSDLRKKVFDNGTLIIHRVAKEVDEGGYVCEASSRNGQTALASVVLRVIVAPKVVPFSAPSNLQQGDRTTLTCTVARGDSPLSLTWMKDGEPLRGSKTVKVIHFDEFNSMLTIESLGSEHIGNYSCRASNQAGQSSVASQIHVHVPPSWIEKPPASLEVTLGRKVELSCTADGAPQPKLTWKKEIGGENGGGGQRNFVEIFNNNMGEVIVSPQGSLVIPEASASHAGRYLCHVSNGVGQPLHTIVNITVKVPPKITVDKSRINAAINDDTVEIECNADGDTPITVKWAKDGMNFLGGSHQGRYSMETLTTATGIKSVLVISQVIKEDEGLYECGMTNPFGSDTQAIKIVVREPPQEPRNLRVLEATSTSARLSWEVKRLPNAEDSLPINSFTIEWTPLQAQWDSSTVQKEVTGHVLSSSIENLRPYTQYKARIKAANDLGSSKPSNVIVFWTLGDKPTGQPLDMKAVSTSPTSLLLQWSDPDAAHWNGAILGFRAGWRRLRRRSELESAENGRHHHQDPQGLLLPIETTLGAYNWTEVERYDSTDLQLMLKDLEPYMRYEILLQAYNQFGRGPVAKLEADTDSDVPNSRPEGVSCEGVTSAGIQLKWDLIPLDNLRGKLTSYKIHYQEVSSLDLKDSSNGGVEQVAPSALKVINMKATFVLKGLRPNGNYSIMLNAQTSKGDGAVSLPIFCPTKPSVPGSPEDLKITIKSDSAVIVSWLPPQRNFVLITGYTLFLRHKQDDKEEVSTDEVHVETSLLQYTVENLSPSVYYQFWVVANSLLGPGNASVIRGYRVSKSGYRSDDLVVGIHSIGRSLQVAQGGTINLPCLYTASGNIEIDWFKDHHQRGRNNIRHSEARAQGRISIRKHHLEITNAQPADAGNYSCQVKAWQREAHDSITYTLLVLSEPSRPRLRLISSDSTSAKLELKVEDEDEKQLLPLLWCSVFHRAKFGQPEETLLPGRNLNSIHINSLKCGTTYSVYATCVNSQGSSGASVPIEDVQTRGQVPVAPSNPADFVHPSNTSVRLDLFTWSKQTCPVDYFIVSYRKERDLHWTLVSNDLGLRSRRFTIRQLEPETSYELKIKANNPAGSTDFSYKFETVSSLAASAGTQLGIGSTQNGGQNGDRDIITSGGLNQLQVMLPAILGLMLVLLAVAGFAVCVKRKLEDRTKRHYLQSEDPFTGEKPDERIYAQVDTLNAGHHRHHLQQQQAVLPAPNQMFYNSHFANMDTMGKIPQNPDDIYPYATFVLPDADCGASSSRIDVSATYQQTPDSIRQQQQMVLNENNSTTLLQPRISTLVFQEQPTLPLSDAYSNSSYSTSNPYQVVHQQQQQQPSHGKKRQKRKKGTNNPQPQQQIMKQQPAMGLVSLRQHQATLRRSEECLTTSSPESSETNSDLEQDGHHFNNSGLVPNGAESSGQLVMEPVWTRQAPSTGYGPPPAADTDTLPSSEEEEDPYDKAAVNNSSPQSESQSEDMNDVPDQLQQQRIFVKKASGGFVGLTPHQLQQMQMVEVQQQQSSSRKSLSNRQSPRNAKRTKQLQPTHSKLA